jgi:hypothetical protein
VTYVYAYTAIAIAIGVLFFARNRQLLGVDAEFIFLSAGVAVLWPIALALDVAGWWKANRS